MKVAYFFYNATVLLLRMYVVFILPLQAENKWHIHSDNYLQASFVAL